MVCVKLDLRPVLLVNIGTVTQLHVETVNSHVLNVLLLLNSVPFVLEVSLSTRIYVWLLAIVAEVVDIVKEDNVDHAHLNVKIVSQIMFVPFVPMDTTSMVMTVLKLWLNSNNLNWLSSQ